MTCGPRLLLVQGFSGIDGLVDMKRISGIQLQRRWSNQKRRARENSVPSWGISMYTGVTRSGLLFMLSIRVFLLRKVHSSCSCTISMGNDKQGLLGFGGGGGGGVGGCVVGNKDWFQHLFRVCIIFSPYLKRIFRDLFIREGSLPVDNQYTSVLLLPYRLRPPQEHHPNLPGQHRPEGRRHRNMYVTRPASLYRRSPEAVLQPPLEGPGSGYLVIQDKEYEEQATCCFGLCKDPYLNDFPFPQNRRLTVRYRTGTGQNKTTHLDSVYLIPVIDQPLSSNRYYVVIGEGKHKGKTSTCSTEENMQTCCFCRCVKDVKPTSNFNPNNIYQQVEILPHHACGGHVKGHFFAKSVAPDGIPSHFLRRNGWTISASNKEKKQLGEALGTNQSLRARLQDLSVSYPGQGSTTTVIVGKWYCPFIFVKEDHIPVKEQLKSSMFYEMTLEQFWEEVYSCENYHGSGNVVKVNVQVQSQRSMLHGDKVVEDSKPVVDGVQWFRPVNPMEGGLGLSLVIAERMRWEQEKQGWVDGEFNVERVEHFAGKFNLWKMFRCYVLVERFALTRMDGSLALTCDFKHTQNVRCQWD